MKPITITFNLQYSDKLIDAIHAQGKFAVINGSTQYVVGTVQAWQVRIGVKILQQANWCACTTSEGDIIYYDDLEIT